LLKLYELPIIIVMTVYTLLLSSWHIVSN
jgi:hypothetical protein